MLFSGLAISVTGLGVVTEALLTCFRFPAIFNQMNKVFRFVVSCLIFPVALESLNYLLVAIHATISIRAR